MRVSSQFRSVAGDQGVEKFPVEGNVDFSMFGLSGPMGQAAGGNDGDAFFGSLEFSSKKLPKGKASPRGRHGWGQGIDDNGYYWNSYVGIEEMQR